MIRFLFTIMVGMLLVQCTPEVDSVESKHILFDLRDNTEIGIDFSNNLTYSQDFNVYKYRNYYNGGGVALGDINNDGLIDVYLVANQNKNRLYLNEGNWRFKDITDVSGVAGSKAWSTGVSMVDINGDGYLDIYVCNSGDIQGENKENEFFINNGDMTFTDKAQEMNLNDKGYSTHASFFDYDKDGDLDCYILNNSFQAIGSFNLRKNERPKRDELGGDKLMRNDNGVFVDVSEEAGIYGSVIGFGLGITVGDVNNDGWDDIFISNDFFERDYLYINNQDGTFREDLTNQIQSISGASMGADIADIDNDGDMDIFVTEMLPSEYERLKTVTTFEDWDKYQYNVANGYHHQFTRNVLHSNNGNNTFSEVGRLANVEASDWSWGALFFDMDNDGIKDLFIANGIYQDLTNQDYLQYVANESVIKSIVQDTGVNYKALIDIIPSNPVANHAYKNIGNGDFVSYEESGLITKGFSNGSAYGDLDNDGDLDLIVNNVNMPLFVYENNATNLARNNFLKIILEGSDKNKQAYGAKIKIVTDQGTQWYENQPIRGFESSMDQRLNVGIGKAQSAEITIYWPDNTMYKTTVNEVNKILTFSQDNSAIQGEKMLETSSTILQQVDLISYKHQENDFVDFNRERLNYHMLSTRGPCVSMADITGDDELEIIIPGSKGSSTSMISSDNVLKILDQDAGAENIRCEVFDANNDGLQDIYVTSGGVEVSPFSPELNDKILINNGKGSFNKQLIPFDEGVSTGAVAHGDMDGDGDVDIFVGERVKIGKYGARCQGFLFENDGKGNFSDVSKEKLHTSNSLGMITDASFTDFDGDGHIDLVIIGEFMNVTFLQNDGKGNFNLVKDTPPIHGWWNVLKVVDIDNDGDQDIVAGNHGLNSRFKASTDHPIRMYYNDYDNNGFPEGIMTQNLEDDKDYPYALRHNLMARLPFLKKKFPNFESFKKASMADIFDEQTLGSTEVTYVNELRSMVLVNDGNWNFATMPLPRSVQSSPMYAIANTDIDGDGDQDLIMGGNLYGTQPEIGRYDASYGHILINDGKGNFEDKSLEYGFSIKGEIRDIEVEKDIIYVFRNNDRALTFKISKE